MKLEGWKAKVVFASALINLIMTALTLPLAIALAFVK